MEDELAKAWAQGEVRRRRHLALIAAAGAMAAALAIVALWLGYREVDFPDIERPLLWRATSPEGKTSYLFGTIHIGYGVSELPAAVLDAQASAEVTVLESDLLRSDPGPPPRPRPERLSPAEWKELAELSGRSIDELQRLDTMHLLGAALLGTAPRKREAMDKGLQRRATKLGKQVEFLLEAAPAGEEGLKLMAEKETLDGVRQVLANPDRIRKYLQSMVNAYGRGEELTDAVLPLAGTLNDLWVDPIDHFISQGGAFIAIGSAHLTGPDSIKTWLERRGHRIERWPW